jgi:hypothetical protein
VLAIKEGNSPEGKEIKLVEIEDMGVTGGFPKYRLVGWL